MLRSFLIPLGLLLSMSHCSAANWGEEMFKETSHDFGTVPSGADVAYRFQIKNKYKEDVRIVNVESSCGCTTPAIELPNGSTALKTDETGAIVARVNSRTVTGRRWATLTVKLEYTSAHGVNMQDTVQLQVKSHIQSDLAFEPEAVRFPGVDRSVAHQRTVTVTRARRPNWRILKATSPAKHLEIAFTETSRGVETTSYEVLVRLKANAPLGAFRTPLTLVTNEPNEQHIVLDVIGRVKPEISATPEHFVVNGVVPGTMVKKKITVRANTPFRILSIDCPDDRFRFRFDKQAAKLHFVEIAFYTRHDLTNVSQAIHIRTDQGTDAVVARATVVPGTVQLLPDTH